MGKAFYRKYRSKSLSEVVGQEHITTTLDNALKNNAISHAYLFTGPHGVGKTSIARILAHEVNGFEYDEKTLHVDIIEIDAASNRRIDEMRDLRDKVHIAPVSGKYKVYIIDEVHMLTREAFNALLKTLEEPPAHVIFILATTEAHKLPETIISRTQRYAFKPIDSKLVAGHLRTIAEAENIQITDEALEIIAKRGNGSFRDSISLLDQLSQQQDEVNEQVVRELLGMPSAETIQELMQAISADPATVFTVLKQLQTDGYDAVQIAHYLSDMCRQQLMSNDSALSKQQLLALLQNLIHVPASPDPATALEVCLIGTHLQLFPEVSPTPTKRASVSVAAPESVKAPVVQSPKSKITDKKAEATAQEAKEPKAKPIEEQTQPITDGDFDWEACLQVIKKKYNTMYGVLRMATVEVDDDTLTFTFGFGFHQKKIADKKHTQMISDVIQQQCGTSFTIVTAVDSSKKTPRADDTLAKPIITKPVAPLEDDSTIGTISNIFGGAEVLE
jgi:DNA polymerase-3 subunit gamma/tau